MLNSIEGGATVNSAGQVLRLIIFCANVLKRNRVRKIVKINVQWLFSVQV